MNINLTKGRTHQAINVSIGFGTALAITISWSQHSSILLAIVHGLLSWFYVIYYALNDGGQIFGR